MLFQFFLSVSLSMASYRYEIDPLWLFGPVQSMRVFGTLAGTAVGTAVQATGAAAWPVLDPGAVVLLAAMAAYSLFLGGDSAERAWGVHPVGPHEDGGEKGQGQDASSPLELQLRACALVARRYGLTRREEDVLALLAQGKTVSAIQEELYVSNPTVKSHVRHIYMKMGIHSREELASAVAAVGAGLR